MAFDKNDNLFVSNWGTNTIIEITPGGVQSTFASGLNGPVGLAFDSAGNLYESNFNTDSILEFTPGGAESTFAIFIDGPTYLAFGPPSSVSSTPEPGSFALASILGLVGVGSLRRRKRRKQVTVIRPYYMRSLNKKESI